ncbi:MAG: hypothetical protein Q8R35_00225, partial [bacterium]|nr:hypothetical protein [bacterium]
VGLITLVCSSLGLTVLGQWGIVVELTRAFWSVSVAISLVILGMICFKLITYQKGGSIALKKLIMQATYLITATILGWAVYTIILPFLPGWAEYAEAFTAGKLLGIAGYVVAFTLMDRGTWEFVSKQYFQRFAPAR